MSGIYYRVSGWLLRCQEGWGRAWGKARAKERETSARGSWGWLAFSCRLMNNALTSFSSLFLFFSFLFNPSFEIQVRIFVTKFGPR